MVGAYLDETGVDQDAGADGIHATADDRGSSGSRVVSRPDTQTRGDTNRCGDTIQERSSNRDPVVFRVNFEEGESRPNAETLKGFYEFGEQRRGKKAGDDD